MKGTRTHRSLADLLLGVLLIGALVLGVLLLVPPLEGYLLARQRVEVLTEQAAALEAENLRLERRFTDLDDPVTIELLARSQQGLVRPGEIPFIVVTPEVDAPRILAPAPAPSRPTQREDLLDRLLVWLGRLTG